MLTVSWFLRKLKSSVIAKGSLTGILSLGAAKIFLFLTKIIIARLGTENFGVYYLITTAFTGFVTLAALGIPMSTMRFVSYYKGRGMHRNMNAIINAGITSILLAGIVGTLAMFLLSGPLAAYSQTRENAAYFGYMSFGIAGALVLLLAKQVLFGLLRISLAYIMDNIESLLRLSAIYLTVSVFSLGLKGAIAGYMVALGVTAAFAVLILKSKLRRFRLAPVFSRELVSYAWPVGISEIVTAVVTASVAFMLTSATDPYEVGYYAAAVSVATLLYLIPQIVLPVFFPVISEKYGRGEEIKTTHAAVTVSLALLLVPAALCIFFFAPRIISMFFGIAYGKAGGVLRWLAVANTFYAIVVWPNRQVLDMTGQTKLNLRLTVIRSTVLILTAALLIPKSGGSGLAMAQVAAWGVEGGLCILAVLRNVYQHPEKAKAASNIKRTP